MAILRDRSIREHIEAGRIGCEPVPEWETQLQPASLDLRLGSQFARFKEGAYAKPIHPGETDVERLMERWDIEELASNGRPWLAEGCLIQPGEFLLGTTQESIRVPADLVARVEGRSTLARMGLTVHITAGFIDPGFHGQITLEMVNHGAAAIRLTPGMRVCQICFEKMDAPAERPYQGKYQNQEGVTVSRTHLDEKGKIDG